MKTLDGKQAFRLLSALALTGFVLNSISGQALAQSAVTKPSPPPKAQAEYSEIKSMMSSFESAAKSSRSKLEKIQEALERFIEKRDQNQKSQDKMGISSDSYSEIIKSLQTQRVNLMIDIVGLQARYDTIVDQKTKADEKNRDSRLVMKNRLNEVLEIQKNNLERLKTSNADKQQQADLELKILDTQIKIATLEKGADNHSTTEIQKQMNEVSLTLIEKRARLVEVNNLLPRYTAFRKVLEEMVDLDSRIDSKTKEAVRAQGIARSYATQLDDLQKRLEKLEQQYDFD